MPQSQIPYGVFAVAISCQICLTVGTVGYGDRTFFGLTARGCDLFNLTLNFFLEIATL